MKETKKVSYQAPELLVIELGDSAVVTASGGIPLPDVDWS